MPVAVEALHAMWSAINAPMIIIDVVILQSPEFSRVMLGVIRHQISASFLGIFPF